MAKESPIIEVEKEIEKDYGKFVPNEEQARQLQLIVSRIRNAREQREQSYDEFDGLSFEEVYLANKRAAMSYLTPKRNDDEVRVNTGVTEKRVEFVFNELLSLNLEEEIETYDKEDNFLYEASQIFTDVVKRTEQIEGAADKDLHFYFELLTQPAAFVEELWMEKTVRSRRGRKGFKTIKRPERRKLDGTQVYLGDIHMPDIEFDDQPYLAKYFRMSYLQGKTLFGHFENFKYVKPGSYSNNLAISYDLYRPNSFLENEIEIWVYESAPENEYQILINGIPMFEPGEPLPWDWDGYATVMVGVKPFPGFAYSKSLVMGAKYLQALDNETIRNLIRKFRQAIEPPMGIKGGKIYSRDIWNAGQMVQGVGKNDFEKLIDHAGVTRSEMAMFDLIEKKINEFVGTSQTEPLQGKSQTTATEFRLAQQHAIKMLGLSVLAAMRLKKRLALLRVKNIMANYTQPIGKKYDPIADRVRPVYAQFSLSDTELRNGRQGTRQIEFRESALSEEEKMTLFKEESAAAKAGKPFEKKVLSMKALDELDLYFYANVVERPKESKELDKVLFQDKLKQMVIVQQVTGRRINAGKTIRSFEKTWRDKDLFEKEAPMNEMMPPNMNIPDSAAASEMKGAEAGRPNKPSINRMEGM